MKFMQKICIGLLLLSTAATLLLVDQYVKPSPEVREAFEINRQIALATVQISLDDGSLGTGVVVEQSNSRALVVTAAHVLEGVTSVLVVHTDGMSGVEIKTLGSVLRVDTEHDLGLVETKPVWRGVAAVITPREYTTEFCCYLRCIVSGYPTTMMGTVASTVHSAHLTSGIISDMNDEGKLRYSAPGMFGNSGGGVFVKIRGHWKLVSIVKALKTVDGNPRHPVFHIGFGARPTDLIRFLER